MVHYIVTPDEAFHDERTTTSIRAARKLRKLLQIEVDQKAREMDAIPDTVKILKVEEVQ